MLLNIIFLTVLTFCLPLCIWLYRKPRNKEPAIGQDILVISNNSVSDHGYMAFNFTKLQYIFKAHTHNQ